MDKQLWRRFFFYVYLMIFIVTAPLVVLYTAGYRFDLRTASLVRTGILEITTKPRSATIFLNDKKITGLTPFIVKKVFPGTYRLRLEKDGYHSWQQEISIKSQETAQVSARLFPESEPEVIVQDENILLAGPTGQNDSKFFTVKKSGQWFEIWREDANQSEKELVSRVSAAAELTTEEILDEAQKPKNVSVTIIVGKEADYVQQNAKTIAVIPSENYRVIEERTAAVLLFDRTASRLILIDLSGSGPSILLNASANFYQWNDDNLIYGDGLEIRRFETTSRTDTLLTRTSQTILASFDLQDNIYLILYEDKIVALDLSNPAQPINTVLLDGWQFQNGWLEPDADIFYLFGQIKDGVPTVTRFFLSK